MIKKISAEIDNEIFELNTKENENTWKNSLTAPIEAKEYTVKIIAEDMAGNISTKQDKKLLVTVPEKLIYYLPKYWYEIKEMYSLCRAEDTEIDFLHWNITHIQNEQFISSSSEKRINQWEKFLKLSPIGSIDERKKYVLSILQSSLKLNEKNLKLIIKTMNGKGATIKFQNSNLIIEAYSDTNSNFIKTVEKIVKPKLPAHLGLNIKKYWCMWLDLKVDYNKKSWQSQKSDFKNWEEIKNYLPPRLI